MKKILPILLLLLAGCANQPHRPRTPGFDDETEREENRNFFYRSWLPQKTTAEDREDRDFFYGSFR
jgi:hypothetical protein